MDNEEIINIPQNVILKLQGLDSITLNHSTRVAEISRHFEKYAEHPTKLLSASALVHDIGKLYISSKILDKPGVLSPLERDIINLHPYISYKILKEDNVDDRVCLIALYHHGLNPPKLKKEIDSADELIHTLDNEEDEQLIKDYSQILHTIDVYEALTSDRPYRRGFESEEALNILLDDSNAHPQVIEFIKYINHIKSKTEG